MNEGINPKEYEAAQKWVVEKPFSHYSISEEAPLHVYWSREDLLDAFLAGVRWERKRSLGGTKSK